MKLFYIVFFCSLSFFSFGQKKLGVAMYNSKTDFSFPKGSKQNEKDVLNKVFEKIGKQSSVKFKVLFNDHESVFFGENKLAKKSNKIDLVGVKSDILGKIYVNLKTKEIIQQKEKYGEKYRITREISNNSWLLTNQKIKIGNYVCYKAVLKGEENKRNKTTAWYTSDIPTNIGPLGFCNLPGLVVMLREDIFVYTLKSIKFSLSKEELKKIKKPLRGIKLTKSSYDAVCKKMRKEREREEKAMYN